MNEDQLFETLEKQHKGKKCILCENESEAFGIYTPFKSLPFEPIGKKRMLTYPICGKCLEDRHEEVERALIRRYYVAIGAVKNEEIEV